MKLKGINPLEQHVEKIVLGVFVVAALGMIAFQFLRDSSVKVNNKQTAIASAYDEAIRDAERLQGRIRSSDLPPGLPESTPDLVAAIRERLDEPVAPSGPLASNLGFLSPGLDGEIRDGGAPAAEYAALEPPAPVDPIARSYAAALDPVAVAMSPALQALVPPEQPYDIRAVSVQATFPASDLVEWLDSDPDGAGPQEAYPKFLWINRLAILDVQLERQELLSSGEYSEPVAVAPTPGLQQATRDALAAEIPSSSVYRSIVAQAREGRYAIVRPSFLPQIAGEPWAPPSAQPVALAPSGGGDANELNRLKGLLESKRRELEEVTEELRTPQGSSSGSDRKSTQGQGIGPGGGGGSGNRDRGPTPEQRRREVLTQRRDRLQLDIQQLEAVVGGPAVVQDAGALDLLSQPMPMLDAGEDMVIWAHDLTAEPGATYRYRIRVLISNPLYGDRAYPDAEPVVTGLYSDWTAPVLVAPQTMVFFTSAQGGIGGAGGPERVGAAAEVYYFFYGYWRKANMRVSPGDAIATTVTLDAFPLYTVDANRNVTEAGTTPTEIEIQTGAFLVDVVEAASEAAFGQRKTRWHVVYRDEDGRLLSRLPEDDRGSPARLRADAAAAAGQNGQIGVPGASIGEKGPQDRVPRAPASNQPAPRPGGGGRLD